MQTKQSGIKLSRRKIIFQILRLVPTKLIRGEYETPQVSEISASDLSQRLASSQPPLVIDTRSRQEYSGGYGHIPGSLHLPMMDLVVTFPSLDAFKKKVKSLEEQFDAVDPHREREVVTVCPGGGFSLVAAEIMAEAGFQDVKSLDGGADGWFKRGYPTSRD